MTKSGRNRVYLEVFNGATIKRLLFHDFEDALNYKRIYVSDGVDWRMSNLPLTSNAEYILYEITPTEMFGDEPD